MIVTGIIFRMGLIHPASSVIDTALHAGGRITVGCKEIDESHRKIPVLATELQQPGMRENGASSIVRRISSHSSSMSMASISTLAVITSSADISEKSIAA